MLESKGCTAIVALIHDQTIYVANAGDSRCILGINGKAVPLSVDHKPALLSEKQRILKAGSIITSEGRIDGNLNLSRAIGDMRYKRNPKLKSHEHPVIAHPEIRKASLLQ